MSKYYIIDTTTKKSGKNPVLLFESVPATLTYLEGMCQRQFGRTRKQHMQHCEDLGFGGDEQTGRAFFEQMEQYFTIGIVRSDSKPIKCNIFEAEKWAKGKTEYGD